MDPCSRGVEVPSRGLVLGRLSPMGRAGRWRRCECRLAQSSESQSMPGNRRRGVHCALGWMPLETREVEGSGEAAENGTGGIPGCSPMSLSASSRIASRQVTADHPPTAGVCVGRWVPCTVDVCPRPARPLWCGSTAGAPTGRILMPLQGFRTTLSCCPDRGTGPSADAAPGTRVTVTSTFTLAARIGGDLSFPTARPASRSAREDSITMREPAGTVPSGSVMKASSGGRLPGLCMYT